MPETGDFCVVVAVFFFLIRDVHRLTFGIVKAKVKVKQRQGQG